MTKADLAELVHERISASKKEAGEVVEEVFAIIRECLCQGQKVKLSGFGTFAVNQKRARRGRNPQTGDEIIIDPRCVLAFKPSELLKTRILNGNKTESRQGRDGKSSSQD